MKSLAKVVAVLCLATVCAGFAYAHYQAKQTYSIKQITITQVVQRGDTLWSIGEQLYNAENEGICFDEWMYNQKQNNKNLFANGRALQPGDKLDIICRVKVSK